MAERSVLVACAYVIALARIASAQPGKTVTCASTGARVECPADTSDGVSLVRATSTAPCVEQETWGFETGKIWVTNGCAGEFVLEEKEKKPLETWGSLEAGKGFLIGRSSYGELTITAYSLVRYLNQLPAPQSFVDHLGRERPVDPRHDIFSHRLMVHLKGWLGLPDLRYQITFWTVNTTDQKAIFGVIGYQFHRAFNLYAGLNGLPASRSLLGSHPFWLGHDRVMADEYFRPYFTHGVWANGEVYPGLWYMGMIGNNNSALGVTAQQLTRFFAYSGTVWWMPTTHEFGPNGSFDDWEWHEDVATRFGAAALYSHENEFSDAQSNTPENTTLRLADSVNLFELGSLAPDVQIHNTRYRLASADAGVKYHGVFVGTQFYERWLDQFDASGPLPVSSVVDWGFYVQAAFYPVKHKLELYGATSWVFGDESAGFSTEHEYLGGANFFPAPDTRNIRVNGQLIWVDRSPVSSSFGYYIGGQRGPTLALSASILF